MGLLFRKTQPLPAARVAGVKPCVCFDPLVQSLGELAQVQAAWARHEAPVRAEWEAAKLLGEGVSGGLNFERGTWHARKYFDLPRFAELEDCFLRVLELPVVIALMKEVIGGAVLLRSIQARTVPADGEGGYTRWVRAMVTL